MFQTFKKVLFVGFCLQVNFAFSQSENQLQDVVITANKYPQKLDQTGKVLTVIGDSVIKANVGLSLGQLLSQQVGVMVIGSGQTAGSTQNVSLRGVNFGHTLILVDGVPVNEASGIGSTFDINLLSLQQIERIEIMKNGQSSLYGSDAIGGVVNIITNRKSQEKQSISASLAAGTQNTLQANFGIFGTLNRTNYNFSQSLASTGGFSTAATKNDADKFENDGFKTSNSQLSITHELTKKLSINGLYRFNTYKTDLDEGAFVDDKDYTYLSKNNQVGGGLTLELPKGKLVFNYLYNQTYRNFKNDSSDVVASAFAKYSNTDYTSKASYAEIFTNFKLHKTTEWLIGADYRAQNMAYDYFSISAFGPYTDTPILADMANIDNQSVYSSLNVNLVNGLGLELGGRLNNHSVYGNNFTYSVNPFFVVNDYIKFFATASSSFKNPALYQLYSPYGNLDLKPENAKTVDLGWQFFGKSKSNYLRMVYFNRQYTDLISFLSTNQPPYGQYTNLAEQKNQGLEVDGNLNCKKFTFSGNYTFLDGKISDDLKSFAKEINAFLRRPNHNFNLTASYSISTKLKGSVTAQHLSKRNDLFYNSATFANEAVILDGFTQIHTNWNYKINETVGLFLNIQNITNKSFTEVYGYSSRPFTALFGLSFTK
ncbi:TonB-dependent receptor plug domain-containing protein [Lacihabitans soyangensis]|uniref:TonB-dependent receptor n=1 Tax=Lacihabitans soyangensis TaxID=869394 RepID=A0AAE3GZ64_9BACT|nr:TonB-dependent receptor [Lacihabitans soyangensis]MCP9761330.1 TonB-dependent receptor [Lacihabitans soyangensis]